MKKITNKNERGITLIALVITIIVLLILAGVAISMLSGENGIINKTNSAKTENETATVEEQVKLAVMAALVAGNGEIKGDEAFTELNNGLKQAGYSGDVSSLPATIEIGENKFKINRNSAVEKVEPVKNPYDPNGWEIAYTCTDGVWNNTPIEKGNTVTGDIVAKLYKIEGKTIPESVVDGLTIPASNTAYHLVIEKIGVEDTYDMVAATDGRRTFNAWYNGFKDFISDPANATVPESFYISSISLCAGISGIAEAGMYLLVNLEDVFIADSVESIGNYAFQSCIKLSNITISENLSNVGNGAFCGCTSLKNITIPKSVTNIEQYAFDSCKNLERISIYGSITNINTWLFAGCTSLKSITIPESVENIEEYALNSCTNLTDIYYEGTQDEWNNIIIETGNEPLTKATIHFNS